MGLNSPNFHWFCGVFLCYLVVSGFFFIFGFFFPNSSLIDVIKIIDSSNYFKQSLGNTQHMLVLSFHFQYVRSFI